MTEPFLNCNDHSFNWLICWNNQCIIAEGDSVENLELAETLVEEIMERGITLQPCFYNPNTQ